MDKSAALKKLEEYVKSGCHLLIPTTQHLDSLSDQFEVIVETVKLSGHPKDRDVYPHENGTYDYKADNWKEGTDVKTAKVRITKQGLNKINILSGIIWSPTLCKDIMDPYNPNRRGYEAVGGVRKPDGTPYFIPKIYAMDLDVEKEKLLALYVKNQNKDYLVARDLLQKKTNIATLCESGAKNRVTREILCLKNFYTVAELDKEFVMVRIIPKLDLTDEYTRRRLIDMQLQALSGIYGMALPSPEPDRRMIEHAAPIDIELVKQSAEDDDNGGCQRPEPENGPGPSLESQVADFVNSTVDDQALTMRTLAKKANYDLSKYLVAAKKASPKEMIQNKRTELFKHLLSLVPAENKEDDVPFDIGRK